jgi:hypothetical protein
LPHEETLCEKGSEGSEGSAVPLSFNAQPGPTSLEELRIRRALQTLFQQHPETREQTPEQVAEDLYLWTDLGYTPAVEDVEAARREL